MIRIPYPIIVEGKYDKSRLASVVDADILTTEGFGVFSRRDKLELFRRLAERGRVVILTDSDRAGFRIRGYLAGALPPDRIINVYIPQVPGKERRKARPSAEGTLGVEGIPADLLLEALEKAGVTAEDYVPARGVTREDLYELGLFGRADSAKKRRALLAQLGLPQGLSVNSLPGVLSRLMTPEELKEKAERL